MSIPGHVGCKGMALLQSIKDRKGRPSTEAYSLGVVYPTL